MTASGTVRETRERTGTTIAKDRDHLRGRRGSRMARRQARFTAAGSGGRPAAAGRLPGSVERGARRGRPPPADLGGALLRQERLPRDDHARHLRRRRPQPGRAVRALRVKGTGPLRDHAGRARAGAWPTSRTRPSSRRESSADRLRAIISRYTAWHARHHVAARVCQFELAGAHRRALRRDPRPAAPDQRVLPRRRHARGRPTGRSRRSTSSGSPGRCCR